MPYSVKTNIKSKTGIYLKIYVVSVMTSLVFAFAMLGLPGSNPKTNKLPLDYQYSYKQQSNIYDGDRSFILKSNGKTSKAKIGKTFENNEIVPLDIPSIYGISISGQVRLNEVDSYVRVILSDQNNDDRLVAGIEYPDVGNILFSNSCEETCAVEKSVNPSLKVELYNAQLFLDDIEIIPYEANLSKEIKTIGYNNFSIELKQKQISSTINAINLKNRETGQYWIAGETELATLTFSKKRDLTGNLEGINNTLPSLKGIEYYIGGYIDLRSEVERNQFGGGTSISSTSDPFSFDWRNRHGTNWLTDVKTQNCGSCWAYSGVGAIESYTNLYFNQNINPNLSEQQVLACAIGGCGGGTIPSALNYATQTGIADEDCYPSIQGEEGSCEDLCSDWESRVWKIEDYSTKKPSSNETFDLIIKDEIVEKGPIAMRFSSWAHGLVLSGFGDIAPGCYFDESDSMGHCGLTIPEDDPLVGKSYWIIKNSWGDGWGENGYGNFVISELDTHRYYSILGEITIPSSGQQYEIECNDSDEDGYCWWGLSETKPDNCPTTCIDNEIRDCNDNDNALQACSEEYVCGQKPKLPSGEMQDFGYYSNYSQVGCCGNWLNEYPVEGMCCNNPDDVLSTVSGFIEEGTFGSFGIGDGEFSYPEGMDAENNVVAIADRINNRIQLLKMESGTLSHWTTFGDAGSESGQFNHPIDVDLSGSILSVVDLFNYRIQLFNIDQDGNVTYLSSFGSQGTGDGEFVSPSSVVTHENLIIVGDEYSFHVFRINHDYSTDFLYSFGSPGSDIGQFNKIKDIEIFENQLFVCDNPNNRVQVFNKNAEVYSYAWQFETDWCERLAASGNHLYIASSDFNPNYGSGPRIYDYLITENQALFLAVYPYEEYFDSYNSFAGITNVLDHLIVSDQNTQLLRLFVPDSVTTCSEVCSDGTIAGQCSSSKPKLCANGELVSSCKTCGCPSGMICTENGNCKPRYIPYYEKEMIQQYEQ
ncbi:hypothetical protein KJ705_04015 [Patescibacteria group bacterium]|nr:hypothetical protein [Patescibacteria group bacterium]